MWQCSSSLNINPSWVKCLRITHERLRTCFAMAFSPPNNTTNTANPIGNQAANDVSQLYSPSLAQPTPSHPSTFPYQGSNDDLRRDSNNESWSGDESNGDEDNGNGDSKKRKRPMSVSCELCKQRKVKCKDFHKLLARHQAKSTRYVRRSWATYLWLVFTQWPGVRI